jgi:uncharacterized RDD family membrane protein YckC
MVTAASLIGSNKQLQDHWVRRVLAAILDVIIYIILMIIIMVFFGIAAIVIPGGVIVLAFIPGLIWFAYFVILEGISGATLGKRFMNLRVVPTMGEMGIVKSIIRNISKIHFLFFLVDWLIGFVTDGDPRQRFMDRLANTTVVRTDAQEVFTGAYQPPSGPMPAPYQPGQPQPQYDSQQQYSQGPQPQGGPAPTSQAPQYGQQPQPTRPEPGPAPITPKEGKVEPIAEGGPKDFTREELVNMRKDELMKLARDKGLKTSGTKRDIIDRLLGEEV